MMQVIRPMEDFYHIYYIWNIQYIYIYTHTHIYIYIYNRNRINKTTVIYTTLSFMFLQFSSIIVMLSKIFLYIKI